LTAEALGGGRLVPPPALGGLKGRSRPRVCADDPLVLALAVGVALAVIYLLWSPPVPDVSAQAGRAVAARLTRGGTWWAGWFGGLPLVSYSAVVPPLMAVLGVPLTGGLAVVATAGAGGALLRGAPRPRVGAVALSVASAADVLGGRTTFAVGTAVALTAALALRHRRSGWAAGLALLSVLSSPLAGLFLGIGALGLFAVDRSRRRAALAASFVLLAAAAVVATLSPGAGRMPFSLRDLLAALGATAAVALLCPQPPIRATAVSVAVAEVVCYLVPSSVGVNIGRLTAVFGAAVVLAFSPWHRIAATAAAVALTVGPGVDLYTQLSAAHDASARRSFYQPLLAELVQRRSAASIGQRIEVVDPRSHGEATYVAPAVPLARGWYRQADVAQNGLFYEPGALTAESYHRWLDSLAVRWVALPTGPLDYASKDEAQLVSSGPGYLRQIWHSRRWTLFEVINSRPLADDATVQPVPGGLAVDVRRPGLVRLRLRWSPTLALRSGGSGWPGPAAVENQDGWVGLSVTRPGRYLLVARQLL
jgi:hypothetical protein